MRLVYFFCGGFAAAVVAAVMVILGDYCTQFDYIQGEKLSLVIFPNYGQLL